MALNMSEDRFVSRKVGLEALRLKSDASVPGGQQAVTKKILRDLVGARRETVLVRPIGDHFEIVAGDMEYLAALGKGEESLQVLVAEMSDEQALFTRLSEAGKRKDINPVEEATMLRILNEEYGITQQEIAMRCGRVQSTVANKIRLLKLPAEALEALRSGVIGERHARALLRVKTPKRQLQALKRCIGRGISAQELEALCAKDGGYSVRSGSKVQKGVVKDVRIYKNALRSVAKEMVKAGLDVSYDEEADYNSWEFRLVLKDGETT